MNRRIHRLAVGCDSQRARGVTAERQDGQRLATQHPGHGGAAAAGRPVAQLRGVKHPDVGTARPRRGELRVTRAGHASERFVAALLAPPGRGDEGPLAIGTGKDDVAWLVTHQQGLDPARWIGRHIDHTDAV